MAEKQSAGLSSLVTTLLRVESPVYEQLVVTGGPALEVRARLQNITPDQLIDGGIQSSSAASALLAAMWLWHDGLDECHRIVQKSPQELGDFGPADCADLQLMTATLAFWHAIMHRREGDFSNSKYWYAKCRKHPAHALICRQHSGWEPFAFVDLVESAQASSTNPKRAEIIRTQKLEWRMLFDWCVMKATGSGVL